MIWTELRSLPKVTAGLQTYQQLINMFSSSKFTTQQWSENLCNSEEHLETQQQISSPQLEVSMEAFCRDLL